VRFLRGGDPTEKQKRTLMAERLHRLEQTSEERRLELERMEQDTIFVARMEDLSPTSGRYFIDYQMRPALAFSDENGLPLLISAKCTHLGCTVASEVDDKGRILCPCHISWFDIRTGRPNAGAPAKDPLPHIGWVVKDDQGRVLTSRAPGGAVEGQTNPAQLAGCKVFIARRLDAVDRPLVTTAAAGRRSCSAGCPKKEVA
jgi:nitrite reductase/ring-hydroxylating ferredoxin subunit